MRSAQNRKTGRENVATQRWRHFLDQQREEMSLPH